MPKAYGVALHSPMVVIKFIRIHTFASQIAVFVYLCYNSIHSAERMVFQPRSLRDLLHTFSVTGMTTLGLPS